jgi:hypothetical protein
MNFDQPYNRNDFEQFIGNFLPDDYTPIEQEIDYQSMYSQKVRKLSATKTLELDVFEVMHSSTHDARVGLSRDAVKLGKR